MGSAAFPGNSEVDLAEEVCQIDPLTFNKSQRVFPVPVHSLGEPAR